MKLVSYQVDDRWVLALATVDGTAKAEIEPLWLEMGQVRLDGQWQAINMDDWTCRAMGQHVLEDCVIRYELSVKVAPHQQPAELDWHIEVLEGTCEAAIGHSIKLVGVSADADALDLPSLYYGLNRFGSGSFARPDPRSGFAFRTDRLAQPAIHYSTVDAAWSYFATDEAPEVAEPELLYSLGLEPATDGVTLFFRYPQIEYGHRGDHSHDAYIAKGEFGPGECITSRWTSGEVVKKKLYLWYRPPAAAHDHGATSRFLWERAYREERASQAISLWDQAWQHVRWFNARLYNPTLAHGLYESPEGSGTAMLGFIEQSLLMPATTLRYSRLARGLASWESAEDELNRLEERAASAITTWVTKGRSEEGILFPCCNYDGFFFGHREYGDNNKLRIVKDGAFETLRLASEAQALLAAAASRPHDADAVEWVDVALAQAEWLARHTLPEGGYAASYNHDGSTRDATPSGTAPVIMLFCDVAHWLAVSGQTERANYYVALAKEAFDRVIADWIASDRFMGATLDASTPDREGSLAALSAIIKLYEMTGDSSILPLARRAADSVLSYTMTYKIRTFATDSDAHRRSISVFGATIVSPENQHLDPLPTAPGLLLYGLYNDDHVAVEAAVETLKWTLDGRWAIAEAEGLKQSEQLLHTRWHYNTFFTERGNYRNGMPLWGRTDIEHAWPQVLPSAAFLETGGVCLDWPSGRVAIVDPWQIISTNSDTTGNRRVICLEPRPGAQKQGVFPLLLRVYRVPIQASLKVVVGDGAARVITEHQLREGLLFDIRARTEIVLEIAYS
ncbi:MAG TPA: hypothetical protein VEX13_18310 [Chloroflexia bacterium]|nr:hypothetical protein [Chloroflexia bacterium]